MTNKELMDKLEKYYLTQDPKIVAKALAGLVLDYSRMVNYSKLPEKEQESLSKRIAHNARELQGFAETDTPPDLRVIMARSDEEGEE